MLDPETVRVTRGGGSTVVRFNNFRNIIDNPC